MFKNIVLHWTAGNYTPSATDLEHYHYVINAQGIVQTGKYRPEDNLDCNDGKYAMHCGGGNTRRIGIAICCRRDINTVPTRKQIEAMCKLAAQLCIAYNLQPKQCITHAEFGLEHPETSSKGKIDINSIPCLTVSGVKNCGKVLRNKIQWYYNKIKEV